MKTYQVVEHQRWFTRQGEGRTMHEREIIKVLTAERDALKVQRDELHRLIKGMERLFGERVFDIENGINETIVAARKGLEAAR